MRELVRRIDAATPPDRDRAVDALRALAILGVVLGHWLVTALIADTGTVRAASPLQHMPQLTPISWLFQTLAVFFLVGGQVGAKSYASARTRGTTYREWLGARTVRLFRPVAAVLVVWAVIAGALLASGVGTETVHALLKLVLSPLWFLLVFAALTAVTPLVAKLHPLWPLAVVLHVDLIRFGLGGPAGLGWINVAAGWLVPYCLGASWAAAACGAGRPDGPCCSSAPPPPPDSSCGPATRRPWSGCPAPGSPTSTRPPSRPSPSASPSAARPGCCSARCGESCDDPRPGRRWRWSTFPR